VKYYNSTQAFNSRLKHPIDTGISSTMLPGEMAPTLAENYDFVNRLFFMSKWLIKFLSLTHTRARARARTHARTFSRTFSLRVF